MKRITKIAALAVLVMGVAAMLQPANAVCGSVRGFTTGASYIFTPGCSSAYYGAPCGSNDSSMTDDARGTFWAIGSGDPAPLVGNDNGDFPFQGGWAGLEPGYPTYVLSNWAADGRIDNCIDGATGNKCMAMLLMDNSPETGAGAFALLTDEPDALGNYNFDQGGPINLTGLPTLNITNSVRIGGGTGVDVTVGGVSLTDIDAGLYLDANCSQPSGGGLPALIRGYQVYYQEVPRTDPPTVPSSNDAADWIGTGEVALGNPTTASIPCSGDTDVYITTGVVFDSSFGSSLLSGNSTRIECGANLAEPEEEIERKPRNREKPRSRSRGR